MSCDACWTFSAAELQPQASFGHNPGALLETCAAHHDPSVLGGDAALSNRLVQTPASFPGMDTIC